MATKPLQKRRVHWVWKVLLVLVVVAVSGAVGTFYYLYATFPKNGVLNDTQDRIAFCEKFGLRGGKVHDLQPGEKMYVFGASCAVRAADGSYAGCVILPKAARLTILVSTAKQKIPEEMCGPGFSAGPSQSLGTDR